MRYPDMFTLMAHLQGMGESNAALLRPTAVSRDVFIAGAAAYEVRHTHTTSHDTTRERMRRGSTERRACTAVSPIPSV